MLRQQYMEFCEEDAAKTVYRTEPEKIGNRLLRLGLVIDYILTHNRKGEHPLLDRAFNEKYEKDKDGTVSVRGKKLVSPKSLQNPNNPDAQYHNKGGKVIKGYSANLTETTDEKGKPNLITDI